MQVLLGIFAALILTGGTAFASNKIEDAITKSGDDWTRWDALFKKHGGTDWQVMKAICLNESNLGRYPSVALGLREPSNVEGSKSQDGKSWGLMQMTIPTARDFDATATPTKLNDPEFSIRLAAQFLRTLRRQFDQLEFVVKSYNQGAGNSRKEIAGTSPGYAHEYWARFQRNYKLVLEG